MVESSNDISRVAYYQKFKYNGTSRDAFYEKFKNKGRGSLCKICQTSWHSMVNCNKYCTLENRIKRTKS